VRLTGTASDRPVPLIDTGEQTRLDYWKEHSEALPRELLEITGWLSREPERTITSEVGGRIERVRAADANNALFRVPDAGPARELWHVYLTYLRREQANRRLLELRLDRATRAETEAEAAADEARKNLERARRDLEKARTRVSEATEKARLTVTTLLEQARAPGAVKPTRGEVAKAAHLVRLSHETHDVEVASEAARRLESQMRVLDQRLERAHGRVRWLTDRGEAKVYIGLWGEINAFLDLQALSVANVASEEFRRHPRQNVSTPVEVELAMERADGD
jgi:exonuclease VII small subunit